jgi:hypothetical protein
VERSCGHKYADSKSSAWYVAENKEVPDSNIGVRYVSTRIIAPWLYKLTFCYNIFDIQQANDLQFPIHVFAKDLVF